MSDFIHYDLGQQTAGAIVVVELDARANVQLVDGTNFQNYRSARQYRFVGGQALRSPVRLEVPHSGHWHVVIDLGGASGSIRSAVQVFANAA
jgi:hypothetical protein